MPGPSVISRGNIDVEMILTVNIAAGTVATNTVTIVTVALNGLVVGDYIDLQPQQYLWAASQPAINLQPVASWCAAANVLTVAFQNATGAAATQTTPVQYMADVARSQNYWANNPPSLPTAIV